VSRAAVGDRLDVRLGRQSVGAIEHRGPGRYRFRYSAEVVERLAEGSLLLSASLPVRAQAFSPSEARPFFEGLLPEGAIRSTIARSLGLSEDNGFALMSELGAECAGAVTIVPAGEEPATGASIRWFDDIGLARAVADLPRHPLGVSAEGEVRLSLGGVQQKLVVSRAPSGQIGQPLGGTPSTHILKPGQESYESLVSNEAFCLRVAGCAGLRTATAEVIRVDGEPCLLVERFDRTLDGGGQVVRLHQEDTCQALGRLPSEKYEAEGGPTFEELVQLLRDIGGPSTARGITELLDATVLNLLLGNSDAHAKNFALLYDPAGRVELAPLYDVVSTNVYPELTRRLAMSIGGTFDPREVDSSAFERLGALAGVGRQLLRRARSRGDRIVSCARAEREAALAEGWHEPVIDRIVALCEARRSQLD